MINDQERAPQRTTYPGSSLPLTSFTKAHPEADTADHELSERHVLFRKRQGLECDRGKFCSSNGPLIR